MKLAFRSDFRLTRATRLGELNLHEKPRPGTEIMIRTVTLMFASASWLSVASIGTAQTREETLALIAAGNRAAVESVRTIHLKFTRTLDPQAETGGSAGVESRVVATGEWWIDGGKMRWVEQTRWPIPKTAKAATDKQLMAPLTREEGVVTARGEMKILRDQRAPDGTWSSKSGSIRKDSADELVRPDVWIEALFTVDQRPRATLGELLDDPKRVLELEREPKGGQQFRLTIRPSRSRETVYVLTVDPRYNYLVTQRATRKDVSDRLPRYEHTVKRFRECLPGVYFPDQIEARLFRPTPDKNRTYLRSIARLDYSDIVINQPISEDRFDFDFPPGTSIADLRDQTRYLIGKDQKPVGEALPLPVAPTGDSVQPSYAQKGTDWSLLAIWAAGIIALLLLGGGAWWIIQRRNRSNATADDSPRA